MLRFLGSLVEDQLEYSVKRAISPLAPYLKKLVGGAVVVILASGMALFGLLFLAVAVFFSLAETLTAYAAPATWVGGGLLAIAVLLTVVGAQQLRSPR
ncbi:hypothetical protein BH11PAT4_BH11PAT4_6000 [soil metagenome]